MIYLWKHDPNSSISSKVLHIGTDIYNVLLIQFGLNNLWYMHRIWITNAKLSNNRICCAYKNKTGKHYKVTKSHIYIPRVTGLPHKMQGLFVNIYFRILQADADPMIAQILQHIQRLNEVWAMSP